MLPLPPPYRLRPMVVADIPAVLAIDRASFPPPAPEQMYLNELTDNQLAHYQVLTRDEAASLVGGGVPGAMPAASPMPGPHTSTSA